MKTVIGIDPGKSGGWVMQQGDKITTGKLDPMCDFLEILSKLEPWNTVAYIEHLTGFFGQSPIPQARVFKMGEYYFTVLGYLEALAIRTELVLPQAWQKALKCGGRNKRTIPQWKKHLKETAAVLYPDCKVVGWNADAYLILEYGLMKEEGLYENQ